MPWDPMNAIFAGRGHSAGLRGMALAYAASAWPAARPQIERPASSRATAVPAATVRLARTASPRSEVPPAP